MEKYKTNHRQYLLPTVLQIHGTKTLQHQDFCHTSQACRACKRCHWPPANYSSQAAQLRAKPRLFIHPIPCFRPPLPTSYGRTHSVKTRDTGKASKQIIQTCNHSKPTRYPSCVCTRHSVDSTSTGLIWRGHTVSHQKVSRGW